MIVVNDRYCPQNHRCPAISLCPQGAISQETIHSGPRVDHDLCTACGDCARICRTFSRVNDTLPVM